MPANELSFQLLSAGIPLTNKTFQEILGQASTDENSEVSLKQILDSLNTNKPVPQFEDLSTALQTVNLMDSNKIQINNLQDAFDDLNVSVKPEEHQMLEKTLDVDEKGEVSLKTALLALKSNKRLQDFREVKELANALNKVTNEKVDVDEVKSILKGLGIYCPKEELQEVLTSIPLDNEGKVDLKDCLTQLKKMPYFTKGSKKEGPLKTLAAIRKNMVTPEELGSIMKNIGVPLPEDVIERLLQNMTLTEDGKVNLEEFMSNLINSGFPPLPERSRVDNSNLDTFPGNMRMEMSGEADFSELDNVLQKMGIKPSPKGHLQPEKLLPVNASRNMYKNKLLTSPKDIKGLQVDDHDLDSILENMAVSLPAEELNDLTLTLPVDANGKFGVNILTDGMDGVKAITGKVDINDMKKVPGNVGRELKDNKYEALVNNLPINGGKVNVSNLDSILGDMRIKLPQKEREKLTENLLLNANGKVELGTLMDAVTNVTGGEVNVSDIESILAKTGIELTDKECLELKKYLPVDAVGKVYQNRVMDGLKTLKGGIVDVAKLDTALQSMGMKLTGMESNDLIKNLPVDDNGKIKMKKLMDALNAFSGKKIDANDLLEVLGNMGIELTEEEFLKLKQIVPIDAAGKVYQKRLLDGVKSLKEGMVKANDLDNVLENLGIELTEMEHEDLTEYLPPDANGKIGLKNVIEAVEAVTGGEVDVSDVGNVLEDMGVTVTDKECGELVKNLPVNANGKVYKNRLLDGLKSLHGKQIDANDLLEVLENMGIELTEEEFVKLKQTVPIDAAGKVYQKRLLDGVKLLKGGMVKANNLDNVLENLGIELMEKEHEDLTEYLPPDANGKIGLKNLMEAVETVTGGEVDVSDVGNVLGNMGVTITDKECGELVKNLPVNANGKVYKNRLLDGLKSLHGKNIDANDLLEVLGNMGIELTEEEFVKLKQTVPIDAAGKVYQKRLLDGVKSLKGGMVKANNLDNVLENLGIELTEKEREDLTEYLPPDENGKIGLKNVMEAVETVTGGEVDVSDVGNVLEDMGVTVTDKECGELVKNLPVNADGKVYKNRLLDGLKSLRGK
uniref:Uncharacterized protein n=1 Tax=Mustela putorius furo TaxID=9669 RepID=M3XVG8_MUSPF